MTHNHKGDAVFWFVIVAASLALLVVASGCKSSPSYSATVQVEADGEREVVVGKLQVFGGA